MNKTVDLQRLVDAAGDAIIGADPEGSVLSGDTAALAKLAIEVSSSGAVRRWSAQPCSTAVTSEAGKVTLP